MRLLIASVAAFAAVAFAAPSFAQEAAAPAPTPSAKPKPGTSAYCNTLKSSTSKSSCLKRVHASAKTPHKTKPKKVDPAKTDSSAQYAPPAATPAQAPSTSQTVAIPPLPQKTI
ncbi:hypothetical protein [Reyranella sp.]|uniref:hypothetical protein n=1 Tax=Reyranella sp. TaxID=1929291 RepID=UPI003D0D7B78